MYYYSERTNMRLLILGVIASLAGCASDGTRVYVNGPATFVTGDAAAVRAYCTRLLAGTDNHGTVAGRATGCAKWRGEQGLIACAEGNETCVAHELRHILDREWRHE